MIPENRATNDSGPGVCQGLAKMIWRWAVSQDPASRASAMLCKQGDRLAVLSATLSATMVLGCGENVAGLRETVLGCVLRCLLKWPIGTGGSDSFCCTGCMVL